MTSNTELFIVNFNKIFSIISGFGQTEFYFPTFANTGSLPVMPSDSFQIIAVRQILLCNWVRLEPKPTSA
jgi:hypothetical protein